MDAALLAIPAGFGLFGALFLAIGVLVLRGPSGNGRETTAGRIIGLAGEPPPSDPPRYRNADMARLRYPIVSFTTRKGEPIEATSRNGSNPAPRVGAEVKVVYDPDHPQRAWVDMPLAQGCVGTAFIAGGGLFIVIAVSFLAATLF